MGSPLGICEIRTEKLFHWKLDLTENLYSWYFVPYSRQHQEYETGDSAKCVINKRELLKLIFSQLTSVVKVWVKS